MIAPLGVSPAVVTELAIHLDGYEGRILKDIVLLHTDEDHVIAGKRLIEEGMKRKYPVVNIKSIKLPFPDIRDENDNYEFMRIVVREIAGMIKDRISGTGRSVYLNLSGGRKITCVSLAMVGSLLSVDGAFHVIHKDVKTFNEYQERILDKILGINQATDPSAYYNEYQEYFDRLLFPPVQDFRVIFLPIIPFGYRRLYTLKQVLRAGDLAYLDISKDEVESFVKAGFIVEKRGKIYPTQIGDEMKRIIEVV